MFCIWCVFLQQNLLVGRYRHDTYSTYSTIHTVHTDAYTYALKYTHHTYTHVLQYIHIHAVRTRCSLNAYVYVLYV
jgi:hypothetical protein